MQSPTPTVASDSARTLSLAEAPQYRAQFLKLVHDVFPRGSPVSRAVSVEQEFALLLEPQNAARNILVVDESADRELSTYPVVAAASYRIFDFALSASSKGASHSLRCAGIGLVVTHPAAQKRGYGYRIQKEIETRATLEGALFTVLWSDLVQFYTKMGYLVAGTEIQWSLDAGELDILRRRLASEMDTAASEWVVQPLSDWSAVAQVYRAAGAGPERSSAAPYDLALSLPNTWAYFAARRAEPQRPLAYGILGKGRDLRDTVHELVGDRQAIPQLLAALAPHAQSGLRVHQPHASPLEKEFEHWLGPAQKVALAFFKVLRGPELATLIREAKLLPSGVFLGSDDTGFFLRNSLVTFFQSPDYGHLLQLFFGPWNIQEMENLPQGFMERLRGAKGPLPLYFWGLDSV